VQCSSPIHTTTPVTPPFNVIVQDTTPPTIVSITASPGNIWPDNHKLVDVTLTVIAVDLVDPAPTWHIVR